MTTNAPRPEVLRYTAFSSAPDGGNPAGVVLDATALDDSDMLAIAADLGYSKSAFLTAPPEGRDPFPVGGVVEDPATGAAAAAFGAYTRELGLVPEDAVLTLHQGEDMGRPGELTVTLRAGDPRVRVSGTGVRIS
ncbi:PhzF family phenazine biosynthesis protein [Streptomyces sp. NPDC001292]|uniref:PhzF family phenazine biosynthesis protein n=1 Tax=Streptomyces sp. NPDC001292 TaxID=3364558 RepID=UPI00369D723B